MGKIKKIKCKRCGTIMVDVEKQETYAVISESWELGIDDDKWDIVAIPERAIECMNCGHKISIDLIEKKVSKEFAEKVIKLVKEK